MGATPVATGGGGGGGGSGTVTSVALSAPAEFSVTGSPITTAGTLALAWQNVAANRVMASPNGSSGTPAFRALVAADLPDLSGTYAALSHSHAASAITSGTFDAARIPDLSATYALAGHLHAGVYAPASHAHAAGDVTSGQMALARGGTGADLSATGAGFLKQASTGAAVSVAALADTDIPTLDAAKIGSGTLTAARIPWEEATGFFGYYGNPTRPWVYGVRMYASDGFYGDTELNFVGASGYGVRIWSNLDEMMTIQPTYITAYKPFEVAISSSDTNAVRTLATLRHETSGVAAAGLGGRLLYRLEDAGGTLRDATSIDTLWQTATGGGTTYTDFYGLVAGASTRLLRLGGNATTARVQLPVSLILESSGLLLSFTNDNVSIRRSNDEMILSSYGTSNRIFSFQQGIYPTTSELFGIYATWCALPAASALNFGANTTDGTWRCVRSGNDLVFERRESGAWVEKGRFTA